MARVARSRFCSYRKCGGLMASLSTKYRELRKNFLKGDSSGSRCSVCHKSAGYGWFEKVSTMYNEWECYCGNCAYERLHQYDDFDAELYQSISEGPCL